MILPCCLNTCTYCCCNQCLVEVVCNKYQLSQKQNIAHVLYVLPYVSSINKYWLDLKAPVLQKCPVTT